jgi:hypothetical protein
MLEHQQMKAKIVFCLPSFTTNSHDQYIYLAIWISVAHSVCNSVLLEIAVPTE